MAVLLLVLSLLELLTGDVTSWHLAVAAVAAVVAPLVVAFGRAAPVGAALVLAVVWAAHAAEGSSGATFGAGMAMLVVAFSLTAWGVRPWPAVAALLVADAARTWRIDDNDVSDVLVDWCLLGLAFVVGRLVHRRTAQAESLDVRLQLTEAAHERETREAVARERAQLARELHDIVAHAVSVMVVQAGTARPRAERVDAELAAVLATVEHSGREALNDLRRLLGVLRTEDPGSFAPLPDLDRLPELIEQVRAAGLDARLHLEVHGPVPAGVALCAYRAVQEGLTNALRHAAGGIADVALRTDAQLLTVTVTDQGGTEGGVSDLGSGNGLAGLRERVLLSGGRMSAGTKGQGFELSVELPIEQSAAGVLP